MPPEAAAQHVGWHAFVQWFWQEADKQSQNKDEVVFDYIWHGGGGK